MRSWSRHIFVVITTVLELAIHDVDVPGEFAVQSPIRKRACGSMPDL